MSENNRRRLSDVIRELLAEHGEEIADDDPRLTTPPEPRPPASDLRWPLDLSAPVSPKP